MKVLCIAEKRMPEVLPYMEAAAKKISKEAEAVKELFDNPDYKDIVSYFVKVEKNGPEGEPVPDFFESQRDAEIVLTSFCPFNSQGMKQLEKLRMIGSIRGGYQHIHVKEATKRGIAVFHVPGRNAHSVSDYTIALMLAEARELYRNAKEIMAGRWLNPTQKGHYQPDLYEKTVGIIGLGAIGRLVAKKLNRGFDMNVLAYDPYVDEATAKELNVRLVELDELFANADFITVHAKATQDNRHLVNEELLRLMKPTAFFVNTARASLVDSQALYQALAEKRIAGAALDVMDEEPIPADNPFLSLDNVTITGHLAGNSSDTVRNAPGLLVEEMVEVIRGRGKRGLVNPEVLENEGFLNWCKKIL